MKRVAIIGSTGSIGVQTLACLKSGAGKFQARALTADKNLESLAAQIAEWRPRFYSCNHPDAPSRIGATDLVAPETIVLDEQIDIFVFASSGYANLRNLLTALERGKTVIVANKELMVIAGELIVSAAKAHGARLLPMDSEPVAIMQCAEGERSPPARAIITASGGAFRGVAWEDLADARPDDALKHPTWLMGRHITIDSATLVNKAFEIAEARHFFGIPYDRIEVWTHPQSLFHALLVFADGSCKAQISPPDMRYSIQYVLNYPERAASAAPASDWDISQLSAATFEIFDAASRPCFKLALDCIQRGGSAPAAFVGANYAAAELFLEGKLKFTQIFDVAQSVIAEHKFIAEPSVAAIGAAVEAGYRQARASKFSGSSV